MNRRSILRGAGALLAAGVAGPAIVRASSLMAISPWDDLVAVALNDSINLTMQGVPLIFDGTIAGWGPPEFFMISPKMVELLRRLAPEMICGSVCGKSAHLPV